MGLTIGFNSLSHAFLRHTMLYTKPLQTHFLAKLYEHLKRARVSPN